MFEALSLDFEALVATDAAGEATSAEVARLEAHHEAWIATLRRLAVDTNEALLRARRLTGPERDQVVADLIDERERVSTALHRIGGDDYAIEFDDDVFDGDGPHQDGDGRHPDKPGLRLAEAAGDAEELLATGPPTLQASWAAGRVVLWGGGPGAAPVSAEALVELIDDAGAKPVRWELHGGVPLPGGARADAVTAPAGQALGWLVGVGSGQVGHDVGPSTRWLADMATWATELVAEGRMVPRLRRTRSRENGPTGSFSVRWVPALVDGDRMASVIARMPGAVSACSSSQPADGMSRAVLAGMVDAICREGATRLVLPAAPPSAKTPVDLAEGVLAALGGARFDAAVALGEDLAGRIDRWTRPVTAETGVGLVVRLAPPDREGVWLLSVLASGVESSLVPVEVAMVTAGRAKRIAVEPQLTRLERLYPILGRPGGQRRGEVALSTDEAWTLMSVTGPVLEAAGFDVQVPPLSRRRPSPALRMFADAVPHQTAVGAQQLCQVRWSVVFDDVELNAADIAKLAAEARPLVKSRGRWIELDRADLQEAAAALAERATNTQLSGAAVLRHALGLESGVMGGPVTVEGSGWAADLLRATAQPLLPAEEPAGFRGKLREYQAQSLGWLSFLDSAGLGGCLALDMGLGKTPTVLAHLLANRGDGPALVITPPAVLGNWAAEAARFAPALEVVIHHGPGRAEGEALAKLVSRTDVLLTTYGTAVRDVDDLAAIDWTRTIVDEAQTIKNPSSDAAQCLRRIPSRSRLALTGTPIENGLGDLWAILDYANPGLVGARPAFVSHLSRTSNGPEAAGEDALRALNGLLVFRRTKAEPAIAAELPDKIDQLDHCSLTQEQIGLYQAVLDRLLNEGLDEDPNARKGQILAAITALKQICNHPNAYLNAESGEGTVLDGRSGKLTRLDEIVDAVFAAGERVLIFTHFARWGEQLAGYLTNRTGRRVACYHGGLAAGVRDRLVREFQEGKGAGALVLSLKAGGAGLNLTAANHVVLFDRWWNPATEDQARDRSWRIGQTRTVVSHRLVCPGTVDERVEEVVAGKRQIADLVLPKQSTLADLAPDQLRAALGLRTDALVEDEPTGAEVAGRDEEDAA
ncbi:MAG TPA: DEAD/DEAH box helicase [Acidimicrobiales bacterium]|nr:DEAD/DEAH box helicase [Acidimicrobiales bacterium]